MFYLTDKKESKMGIKLQVQVLIFTSVSILVNQILERAIS